MGPGLDHKRRDTTGTYKNLVRPGTGMEVRMRRLMILIAVAVFLCAAACEKADKAFDAVDKAKNLKADLEKKAEEAQKGLTGAAEAYRDKVREASDILVGPSGKNPKKD
jgi:hypothetical protein